MLENVSAGSGTPRSSRSPDAGRPPTRCAPCPACGRDACALGAADLLRFRDGDQLHLARSIDLHHFPAAVGPDDALPVGDDFAAIDHRARFVVTL